MAQRSVQRGDSVIQREFVSCFERLFPSGIAKNNAHFEQSSILSVICKLGSISFEAYKNPEDFGTDLGIPELTKDGTMINHLNRIGLSDCYEGVLKITLRNATNVKDMDGAWKGKSDPYLIFTSGISMSKSAVINDSDKPTWNSAHYLFIRKKQLASDYSDVLHIDLMDCDTFKKTTGNLSLETMLKNDDRIGSADLQLSDLKTSGIKSHSVKVGTVGFRRIPTLVNFSTQFLSMEDLFKEFGKDNDKNWLDRHRVENNMFPWSKLCTEMKVPQGFVQPVVFFDSDCSGTQAWLHIEKDSKTVILAFRGTEKEEAKDVEADVNIRPMSAERLADAEFVVKANDRLQEKSVFIHGGFLNAYLAVQETIMQTVYGLTNWDKEWLVCVIGHSLGGALAVLGAYEIANRTNSRGEGPDVGMLSVGAPKMARDKFIENYTASVPASYRVVNKRDIVHYLPPLYSHVKSEVIVEDDGYITFEDSKSSSTQSGDLPPNSVIETADKSSTETPGTIRKALNAEYHLQKYYFTLIDSVVQKFIS